MPHLVKTLVPNVTLYIADGPPVTVPDAQTTLTLDDISFSRIAPSAFASSTTVPKELTADKTNQANAPYQGLYYSNTGTRSAYLQDLGAAPAGSVVVTAQANYVAADGALSSTAPAALTSTQNATAAATDLPTSEALANALKTSYNAAQVDLVALRGTLLATQADLASLRTVVNNELAALQAAGAAQKSS